MSNPIAGAPQNALLPHRHSEGSPRNEEPSTTRHSERSLRSEESPLQPRAAHRPIAPAGALVLLFLLLLSACTPAGQFTSNRPPAAEQGAMSRQPAAVTFMELDANPAAYRNRLVRVSGAFLPAPEIECQPYKGPTVDWSLVDNELRLDVQGFARIVTLIPEDTQVTVDGFWQLYEGPVGCGKEPPRRTLWYLRAVRFVQPNPLPQLAALPEQPAEVEQEGEPTATPEETGTPTPTPSPSPSPTPSPTGGTPTPDLTASPTPTLELEETGTPTPSPTVDPGETPQPTATPSPTLEAGETPPPPPGETPTPSGYPDPTATPDPYG